MDNLTIVVPYRDGAATLGRLLASLPAGLPVVIVDDCSEQRAPVPDRPGTTVIRLAQRGYFAGAVNRGIRQCQTDVLVLNQDVWLEGSDWLDKLAELRRKRAVVGDGVFGHPAWPAGYVQGTFMFMRRDAIEKVGPLNERDFPLWGSTCEWQLRACRKGFRAAPLKASPWLRHEPRKGSRYGAAITRALQEEPGQRARFVRTPPLVSVVVPAYNHARYLPDCVASLVGGQTSLGPHPGQGFAAFEVIVVDDASTDDTQAVMAGLVSPWTAVRCLRAGRNRGTAAAENAGIRAARGRFVQVLAADDMLEAGALEASYRVVERDPRAVAYSDQYLFKDGKRFQVWKMSEYDFDKLLGRNHVPAGVMYARAAWEEVGGVPDQFGQGREDWAMAVRLGRAGYCGVRVPQPLYLYRRAGQNRSLRNSTPAWRERFVGDMLKAFPDLYRGERPVACCGGSRRVVEQTAGGSGAGKAAAPLAGRDGMVLLEYIGRNIGRQNWWGPATGTRYQISGSRRLVYVDRRDAQAMVGLRRDKGPVFRRASLPKPPAPPPVPAPAPKAAVAPPPLPAAEEVIEVAPLAELEAEVVALAVAAEAPVDQPTRKPRARRKKAADA